LALEGRGSKVADLSTEKQEQLSSTEYIIDFALFFVLSAEKFMAYTVKL
jgi:hypothetical protein